MSLFSKYNKGIVTIEIQSFMPERFINLLWKEEITIKNVTKKNITTMTMDIELKHFGKIEDIAKRTNTKFRIVSRKGIAFLLLKARMRTALALGTVLFIGLLYFLSTFIWKVEIITEKYMSPYEVRRELMSYGINPGITKRSLNVYKLEERIIKDNENIMWVRARIEGAKLKVTVAERISPPVIISENEPCDLVAQKDGQVVRVFTTAGTSIVKEGDIIKAGQILVKGEQGKDGNTYQVHAAGSVIARTFYEETKEVAIHGMKKVKTGNTIENYYIEIKGKRYYLKKSLNNFSSYDRIEERTGFLRKETFAETKDVPFDVDVKKLTEDTDKELYAKIALNFDKTVTIIDRKTDTKISGDKCTVRLLVVAEEDIAVPKKSEVVPEKNEKVPEKQQ